MDKNWKKSTSLRKLQASWVRHNFKFASSNGLSMNWDVKNLELTGIMNPGFNLLCEGQLIRTGRTCREFSTTGTQRSVSLTFFTLTCLLSGLPKTILLSNFKTTFYLTCLPRLFWLNKSSEHYILIFFFSIPSCFFSRNSQEWIIFVSMETRLKPV